MKLITLDPYNENHKSIMNQSSKKDIFKSFMSLSSVCSKEEYEKIVNRKNEIFECLLKVEQTEIDNYCIFTGTKDNRLIQINIENPQDKKFLEQSVNYAFQVLNAYTITMFSDTESSTLESLGFESLGEEKGKITYIKEQELDLKVEKLR